MGNAKPPAHSGGRSPAGGESLKPAPDTLPCSSPVLGPARALLPAPPPTLGPAPPLVPPLGPAPALPPDPPHPRPGSCAWGVHSARVHQAALAGRAKPGLGVPLGGHRRWRAALLDLELGGVAFPGLQPASLHPSFQNPALKKKKKQNPALRDSFFGSLNCEHKNRHKYNPAVAGWGERGGQSADCGNGATAHHLYSRAWGGPWTCGPESLASRARELGPTAQLSH